MNPFEALAGKINELNPEFTSVLHAPQFDRSHASLATSAIEMGLVSTYGEYTRIFEAELSDLTSSRVIATSSGTAALHLALLASGVKPGEIVFCPAISFVATANAILYCGAQPYFIDVDESLFFDAASLRQVLVTEFEVDGETCVSKSTGEVASAVIVLHPLGTLMELSTLEEIAIEFKLKIIEDAAQCFGAGEFQSELEFKPRHARAFSFNGNKILTTGGGGAVALPTLESYDLALTLATVGRVTSDREVKHSILGFNYRMPSLNAALGLASLKTFAQVQARKRAIRDFYLQTCAELGLQLVHEEISVNSNFWLNAIRVPSEQFSDACRFFDAANIGYRRLWTPLPSLGHLSSFRSGPTSGATENFNSVICLPSSPALLGNVWTS